MALAACAFTACQGRLDIPQKGVVPMEEFYQTDEDAQDGNSAQDADQQAGHSADDHINNDLNHQIGDFLGAEGIGDVLFEHIHSSNLLTQNLAVFIIA